MITRRSLWCAILVLTPAALMACSGSTNDDLPGGSGNPGNASSTGNASGGSAGTSVGGSTSMSTTAASGGAGAGGAAAGSGGGGAGGAPGDTVRLIAIGDTGEGNDDQNCLAWAMSNKCIQDGCDAVLLAGDNFYDVGVTSVDDIQWMPKFELPYDRPGLNGLPFYIVLGNHDYAPGALSAILDHDGSKGAQIAYTSLPVGDGNVAGQRHSDKWTLPSSYYDVVLGNGRLHLFGMDGQDASDTQLNDMSQRVNASTATWKLVFDHFPRYTSGGHSIDMDALNFLSGLSGPDLYELEQAIYCDADVFLSGHDHDREFMSAGQDSTCPNTSFIVTGAGAKVNTSGNAGQPNQTYFNNTIPGFFYLIFEGDRITVESYDKVNIPGTQLQSECAPAGNAMPAYTTTIVK